MSAEAVQDLTIEGTSKAGSLKMGATEGTTDKILNWWERCYKMTLDWVAEHPVITVLIIGFLTFWRWQAHLTKTTLARQKAEYEAARSNSRGNQAPHNRLGGGQGNTP